MKHLIGKRFELTEVGGDDHGIMMLTFVSDDEVVRLEPRDIINDLLNHSSPSSYIAASIESLVEPHPGEEVLRDVFAGTFVTAPDPQ